MSADTIELVKICEALPEAKRQEVTDFALFLLSQSEEARWNGLLENPKARPRLDAFLRESAQEADELLDESRL